jgi:hypothetical protein
VPGLIKIKTEYEKSRGFSPLYAVPLYSTGGFFMQPKQIFFVTFPGDFPFSQIISGDQDNPMKCNGLLTIPLYSWGLSKHPLTDIKF